MTLSGFFPRSALFIFLACLLLTGCPKQPVVEIPQAELSEQADITYQYLRFESARRRNDVPAAMDALRELLPLAPSEELYVQAGAYLLESGDYEEARTLARNGLAHFPENYILQRLTVETYLREQRVEEGTILLEGYVAAHPDNTEAVQDLILLLIQSREYARAEQLIRTIAPNEYTPYIRYYRAAALSGLGRKGEAALELQWAVQEAPEFIEAWVELAYIYEQTDRLPEAEQAYEQALGMAPDSHELWMRLLTVSLRMKNYAKALQLTLQGPQSPGFLLTSATMFMSEGLYPQAKQILDQAVETPGMPDEVNFYQAVLAFEYEKNFEEAIDWLNRIPSSSTYYERALRMKGQIQFENNDVDGAFRTLEEALEHYPDRMELHYARVELLIYADRMEDALAALQTMRERWPDDPEVEYHWGALLDSADRKEEAMAAMEALLLRHPDHAETMNYIGYSLAEENRDLQRALELITRADELLPDNAHIVDSLAWVHYRLGNMERAWQEIQRCIELGAQDPTIWEHCAAIAQELGKDKEAAEALKRADALRPPADDEQEGAK